MNPSGPQTPTASTAPEPSTADASFSLQIESINTSALEQLAGMQAERARYQKYRDRAEELKTHVSEPVYRKVADDYSRRLALLDDRTKPMKADVLAEYQRLHTLLAQLKVVYDDAREEREELEFRHAVGELNDSELAEGRLRPNRLVEQYEAELQAAEQIRARFSEALGIGDDPIEVPTSSATTGADGVDTGDSGPDHTRVDAGAELEMAATTLVRSYEEAEAPTGITMPALPQQTVAGREQTFILPLAALIEEGNGGEPQEHRLGVLNYLGRAEDNQIQVTAANISRRHAVIEVFEGGYLIKDLESQNGTFVNGDRITEHALVNGDRIQIGTVHFVFRSPWSLRRDYAR